MTEDLPMFQGMSDDMLGPQLIAPVALFLASDLAADINGQIVGVQGRKVFLYQMETTDGVLKEDSNWTPEELREKWPAISNRESAKPAPTKAERKFD